MCDLRQNINIHDDEHDFGEENVGVPSDLRGETCGVLMVVCIGVLNTQDFMFHNYSQPL